MFLMMRELEMNLSCILREIYLLKDCKKSIKESALISQVRLGSNFTQGKERSEYYSKGMGEKFDRKRTLRCSNHRDKHLL